MKKEVLTTAEAKRLLELEKEIDIENSDSTRLRSEDLFVGKRYTLLSVNGIKQEKFYLSIKRSAKKIAKISFHHFHGDTSKCLFRIDFAGTHKNPEVASAAVPDNFAAHAGEVILESHVHYYLEGEDENWALPIGETEFRDFSQISNLEDSIQDIINKVNEHIHLTTRIIYDKSIPYDGADK
ncbi:MAG: hypothetical protein NC095_06155 [Muribaculum sp.]|nr:hypothetical protein [Muribaculum sp.]